MRDTVDGINEAAFERAMTGEPARTGEKSRAGRALLKHQDECGQCDTARRLGWRTGKDEPGCTAGNTILANWRAALARKGR